MRNMNLLEIQKVSVDILKEIDSFCRENSIDYSLGYGGLIGAIRHKGCIPWDDDLDIIMSRPNYEKFIRLYHSSDDQFKVFAPELGNSYFAISRICEMKRTKVLKYYQWTDEQTGIFIDIFPMDALPSDQGNRIKAINRRCFRACRASRPFSIEYGYKNIMILWQRIVDGQLNRRKEIDKYLEEISLLDYDKAEIVCNLSSPYMGKDVHSRILFDKYIRVPFEDIEVNIIEGYDEYLRNIYGDYMKLPPPNMRICGHTANNFYWL